MSIIIDLIILAIIFLCVIISAKRGFVKVLVETVGFVAAIVIAFSVSSPLAELTYDKVIEPPVVKAAVNAVSESAEHEAFNALPDFLTNNDSAFFGTTVNSFTEKITENLSNGTETAVKTASQEIVKPVASKLLGLLYSVILILVLLIVVKFLAKLLNGVFSFSLAGKLNRTLGGVIGAVKGILFAVVFCLAVSLIVSFSGKPFLIFSEESIANSYIFNFITEFLPFN